MSTIKVDTITNYDSAVDFSQGFKLGGADVIQNYTESATVPQTPTPVNGDYWWDTANDVLYRYMDGGFRALGVTASTVFTWGGDRGVFAGGDESGSAVNRIQYIDITTPGNSTDFGDLTVARRYGSGASNSSRGLHIGGNPTTVNIDYVTISTPGNAQDFGDLQEAHYYYGSSCSDGTKAFTFGGYNNNTGTVLNNIQQTVIATTGNSTDFGDISVPSYYNASCADTTRAVFSISRTREAATSGNFSYVNNLEYITTASAGNSTDFGDTTLARGQFAACSDSTRGLFAAGYGTFTNNRTDTIDYITIQTAGNATDFGDLSQNNIRLSSCANTTRGIFGGGYTTTGSTSRVNTIEYVTIQTPGNATDFGDIAAVNYGLAAFSGSPS